LLFILISTSVYISVILLLSFIASMRFSHPIRNTNTENKNAALLNGEYDPELFSRYSFSNITFKSQLGYSLKGISYNAHSKTTVIVLHGYNSSHFGMLKHVEYLMANSYNLLLYDQRSCGRSGGKSISAGQLESKDIDSAVDFAVSHFPLTEKIVLLGQSMGAVSALLNRNKKISARIAFSPFSSIPEIVEYKLRQMKIPVFLSIPAACLCRVTFPLAAGTYKGLRSTTAAAAETRVPTLLFHSLDDLSVPFSHAEKILKSAAASDSRVTFVPFESGGHGTLFINNKEKCIDEIERFLKTHLSQ
jgi:alpha-beta hydrolase superfamily lysophospholipase